MVGGSSCSRGLLGMVAVSWNSSARRALSTLEEAGQHMGSTSCGNGAVHHAEQGQYIMQYIDTTLNHAGRKYR